MMIKKLLSGAFIALSLLVSGQVVADDKHEMENSHVTIDATEHRNGRQIEMVEISNKKMLKGKSDIYKRSNLTKLTMPYAEYGIESKVSGGDYRVTVIYRIEKDNNSKNNTIILGMDELSTKELDLKNVKGVNQRIETTFDVKALRGKNHVLKVWLPSKGVAIDKFEVRRKLLKSK